MRKHDVRLRIRVLHPFKGVTMQVQRGKDEMLPPAKILKSELIFEFLITVDLSAQMPNFLGKYAQGPKDARFVYVNSGKQAGQEDIYWDRRAKIPLMSITKKQIEELTASPAKHLETAFNGTGPDGGPTCASVKGIEWRVVEK